MDIPTPTPNPTPAPAALAPADFRVVAVGRAGINALEVLLREGFPGASD